MSPDIRAYISSAFRSEGIYDPPGFLKLVVAESTPNEGLLSATADPVMQSAILSKQREAASELSAFIAEQLTKLRGRITSLLEVL